MTATLIQLYDVDDLVRQAADDECPTCHNEPFVDVMNGDPCPTCGGDPANVLERNLSPLREAEIQLVALKLGMVLKEVEAEAQLLEEHAARIAMRAKARRNRADRLKQFIQLEMESAGVDRVKNELVTVYLQDNPASIDVNDLVVEKQWRRATLQMPLVDVPPELEEFITRTDVLKDPLKKYVEETGHEPAGVTYVKKGERRHLRIRA